MKRKILLVHGWNYVNYSSYGGTDAWSNRTDFIDLLESHFEVIKFNLPGFCGEPDPQTPWSLDDFVEFVDAKIKSERPDCVLGYSFGGAILLRWKFLTRNTSIKTFLVSPAIMRHYAQSKVSSYSGLKSLLPTKVVEVARDLYMTHILQNPFYAQASPVMKETYRKIVVEDLRSELLQITDKLTLIYGECDEDTPPSLVTDVLSQCPVKHKLHVIDGGGHDIANTHTEQLISYITRE